MSLINLTGNMRDLDQTLIKCLESEYFHPEMTLHSNSPTHGFATLEEHNPYSHELNRTIKLADDVGLELKEVEYRKLIPNHEYVDKFLSELEGQVEALLKKKSELLSDIHEREHAIIQIKHLEGLATSFDDIFSCEYVSVRFGRLPYDSFEKLDFYNEKTFFFFPFDNDSEYYWGVYFAPMSSIGVIDDIFSSLYFERVRIPDYAHGTPEIALANITEIIKNEKQQLEEIEKELKQFVESNKANILHLYCQLVLGDSVYKMKKNIGALNKLYFVVMGFIPKDKEEDFVNRFKSISSVGCEIRPGNADPTLDVPVQLKNGKFTKPFESFVEMYSLPSHKDIDLTPIFAVTYTLLFGVMFGDLGQGIVLALIGALFAKKNALGAVLVRLGISSAFCGFWYGSVFGYEHVLDPVFIGMGFAEKPIHVFDVDTTNLLLGGSIGLGVVIILMSMIINIIMGIKHKDYVRGILGNNGLAGLVMYTAVVAGGVQTMLMGHNVFSTGYILGFIVVPFLIMFFKEPLSKLLRGKGEPLMPHGWGEFIAENFFELFEYLLSYMSNTMSFLRIGGLILSHAGMMAVVMSLSEMTGGVTSTIVIIIGNMFVMCLEGLIVGIQVLRLEFYEFFSRNFEGNGKAFEPAIVTYNTEIIN